MENNDYLEIIQQAYLDRIQTIEDKYQAIIISKDENIQTLKQQINDLKSEIIFLRELVDKRENKLSQVYNQYNIQSPGVNMSNISDSSSGDKINYNLQNSTIGGGIAGRDYRGDIIHNYSSSELNDTIRDIQKLIDTLSQNSSINSTSEQMKIATQVIERIENTPTWKQKAINAAKQGLLEAMKSNPIGAFVAGAIEGW
ncbi:hypothetical protein [Aphanothece sacrum]|uniref:Miro domain-containing protein n=1 Tax=Aphanothece sacrum FPU1 TaxID=1920663 RepID=A0A401ILC7_APHSA|nr:hypothetical protein [Aphanothece sacrum]GBF82064.1 Miro domain-containing protein [Aphanothece sacrum FPU1]